MDVLQRVGLPRHVGGDRERQSVRFSRVGVGVLTENDDLDVVVRRQRERLEGLCPRWVHADVGLVLAGDELEQLGPVRLVQFVAKHFVSAATQEDGALADGRIGGVSVALVSRRTVFQEVLVGLLRTDVPTLGGKRPRSRRSA